MTMSGRSARTSRPSSLLERSLAGSLALHIAHVIVLGELVICCRIPINGVDAVQDTAQDVVAATQNTVKMLAVLGRLNLGRIGGDSPW